MRCLAVKLLGLLLVAGCQSEPETRFTRLPASATGVDFTNQLSENDTFNILNYLYYYNGGGVAIGDVNNDGWADLYFTANEQDNRLYLNQGGFRFKDVSHEARVTGTSGWTTGVTMADVNGDGWLDIYVCQLGNHEGVRGRNQLYINDADTSQGYPTFTERAAAFGLDQRTFATQAAFFDYDRDGDLDVYLLNHTVHSSDNYVPVAQGRRASPQGDQLLRNDTPLSPPEEKKGGVFVDVSQEAGIYRSAVGYGLSVSVADLNQDGWPDIYVGNDFHENDYLYYNQGDGTFQESITEAVGHTSRFTMGTDVADFNNDARPDIISLDMKPADERVRKLSAGEDPYNIYQFKLSYGYHHQNARNALQLNVGNYRYSEIGQLAGVAATDWSWAPLFADLDNDGWKDLYITNGILRRPNNLDYIRYISNREIQTALERGTAETKALIQRMPSEKITNYAFKNRRDLTFSNQTEEWGLNQPGFSNGGAYGDLDNDGDLDLVVNNVNDPAFVYRNNSKGHYLRLRLVGEGQNTFGIGTRVWLYVDGRVQYQEMMPTRGFQSSVEPLVHFGLGRTAHVDSLVIVWPQQQQQVVRSVPVDTLLTVLQRQATQHHADTISSSPPLLTVNSLDSSLYYHRENDYADFDREPFLPHVLSREGPALAVADVNGDALDDIYLGGAAGQPGVLLLQQADGTLSRMEQEAWQADRAHEDVAAAWLDADNDGDLDLYVGSAGNEPTQSALADRLYRNDGAGHWVVWKDALPPRYENTACVVPSDVDKDGDTDLFVGVRNTTGNYGVSPRSYLLENDGSGQFTAINLPIDGMVTDAIWSDYDQDGWEDLVVVGEWMPIMVLKNKEGQLLPQSLPGLEKSNGWWNTIEQADLDGDGDQDWIVGNLGHNAMLRANPDEPVSLYVNDFDSNGTTDPLMTYYRQGEEHAVATLDELVKNIPSLRKQFNNYQTYAQTPFRSWFPADVWKATTVRKAYTFSSSWVENKGAEGFLLHALPTAAQFGPVHAIVAQDINNDGLSDILLAGNTYEVDPKQGRYDAGRGLLFISKQNGQFDATSPTSSGIYLEGQVRHLATVRRPKEWWVLAVRNNMVPLIITSNGEVDFVP
ncbi:MAG: VCBS repeat-containing protein [Tunicatimonas sp.]